MASPLRVARLMGDFVEAWSLDLSGLVILTEAGESWITAKLVYFIDNYGGQFLIGDKVITAALRELEEARIELASPRLDVAQTVPENAV